MGQYYLIVNIEKQEYLNPHRCGDGLKLLEFGCGAHGTMTALAILLADGNNRGGGDLRSAHPIIGSWAGDRVVIAGDYADPGRFTGDPGRNLYNVAREEYRDVSRQALRAMADDGYLAAEMRRNTCRAGDDFRQESVYDFALGGTPQLELLAPAAASQSREG